MFITTDIRVLDDLLTPPLKAQLYETIAWLPMYFLNRSARYQTDSMDIHWYYPLAIVDESYTEDVEHKLMALDDSLVCVKDAWALIKKHVQNDLRLYECMVSANTFGTEGHIHHDVPERAPREKHLTILVYCNKEWKMDWAGETLFFDEQGEVNAAVIPKPGRVLICKGDPVHVGRSVSRICPTDRRVLVFKAWLEA